MLNADGSLRRVQRISDWEGGLSTPLRDGDPFGRSVAALGDLDGDRVPDMVVGSAVGVSMLLLNIDGTVKQDRRSVLGEGQDTEVFGTAVAVGGRLADGSKGIRLAVGGSVALSDTEDDGALWLVRLLADGTLSSQ